MSAHLAREPEPQCLPPSPWIGLTGGGEASQGVSLHSFLWRQRVPSSGRRANTNSKHYTGDAIYPRLGITAAGEYSPTWCCLERKLMKVLFFYFIFSSQDKLFVLKFALGKKKKKKKMILLFKICRKSLVLSQTGSKAIE